MCTHSCERAPAPAGWTSSLPDERLDALRAGNPGLIRRTRVEELTGISRAQIYRLLNAGRFPVPLKLSARLSAWRAADVMAWIEEQGATA